MKITDTSLEYVNVITPHRLGDRREYFSESWGTRSLESIGVSMDFVQDNYSMSRDLGTGRARIFSLVS